MLAGESIEITVNDQEMAAIEVEMDKAFCYVARDDSTWWMNFEFCYFDLVRGGVSCGRKKTFVLNSRN